MTDFSKTVDIAAPADRVWTVMIDVERWPEWTSSVQRIERLDAGPLTIGSRARVLQPRLLPATWEVTSIDPGKSFTWMTKSPGIVVVGIHRVDSTDSGSRATLSLQFRGLIGPLVGRLLRGLNERYLSLEAAGLKRRSEAPPS
jgi:uncharacterized membrane protein